MTDEKNSGQRKSVSASEPVRPVPADNVQPRRHHWGLWLLAAIVVVIILARIFWPHQAAPAGAGGGGGRGGAGGAPPPPQIGTTKARKGDIGIYVNALGVVTPLATVSVKSRVDGQLVNVEYKEGQQVKVGDPLVEIDPAQYQAAVDQAQGQLARDQALLENANLDLSRYQEAYSKNAIPKQQLDTQGATVHQYEGIVKLDQAQLNNAKVQLAYCHITSPLNGRVGLRLVDAGNIVHSSDTSPLVVITELQPITVIFTVAEDYLPQILAHFRDGKQMTVDAFDRSQTNKLATGGLETIDNQIDPSTGTIKLKAIFTNDDEALFPNQFVNARLLVDTLHDATLLPNTVIQRNSQGAYVYLVKPDQTNQTVAIQTVTVRTTDGNTSAVEGIEPGAVVAANNFNRLTDGAKVTLRTGQGGGQGGSGGNGSGKGKWGGKGTNGAPSKERDQ